jgi:hypothetical protein
MITSERGGLVRTRFGVEAVQRWAHRMASAESFNGWGRPAVPSINGDRGGGSQPRLVGGAVRTLRKGRDAADGWARAIVPGGLKPIPTSQLNSNEFEFNSNPFKLHLIKIGLS